MPVKIRLMRIGAKKRPFYRVVAVDERKKRTGGYLDLLGTYNPLTEPKEIKLNQVKIDDWMKKGAVLSDGFLRIIGKAPQRPPRKPKKDKGTPTPAATPTEVIKEEPKAEVTSEEETQPQVTEENTPPAETAPETKEEPTSEQSEPASETKDGEETKTEGEEVK